MTPLKWGAGEFGVFLVLRVYGKVYAAMGVIRKGTPTWDNTHQ